MAAIHTFYWTSLWVGVYSKTHLKKIIDSVSYNLPLTFGVALSNAILGKDWLSEMFSEE